MTQPRATWILAGASVLLVLYLLAVTLTHIEPDIIPTAASGGGLPAAGRATLVTLLLYYLVGVGAFGTLAVGVAASAAAAAHARGEASVTALRTRKTAVPKLPEDGVPGGGLDSREMLRGLLDHTSAVIYVLDREGRFLRVNRRFQRVFGVTSTEMPGRTYDDLFPPEVAEPLREHDREVLDTGLAIEVEEQLPHDDGPHPYLSLKFPLMDGAGAPIGVCTISTDVKERKEATEALAEQISQAQKLEAVGTLAGGLAHDFNNTLTAILGSAALALRRLPEESPGRKELARIKSAGERAAELTKQLLTLGRRSEPMLRAVDLNDVLTRATKLLQGSIPENIEIRLWPAKHLPPVRADSGQLEQVFLNLGINARDAMPDGGRVTYETSVVDVDKRTAEKHPEAREERFVRVSVSDNGTGMPPDIIERIFEPFFTTKEMGKGTGLGLAMVRATVQDHGGWMTVDSVVGRGTVFALYFPLAPADAAGPVVPLSQEGADELVPGTETILLVDDDEDVRALGQDSLRACGYTVLAAEDGEHAMALLAEHDGHVDLILTDLVMPRLGGRELLEAVRHRGYNMPVSLMTGYIPPGESDIHTSAAFSDVVYKPFTPQSLSIRVRVVLETWKTRYGGTEAP